MAANAAAATHALARFSLGCRLWNKEARQNKIVRWLRQVNWGQILGPWIPADGEAQDALGASNRHR